MPEPSSFMEHNMTYIERIVNIETGETTERALTNEEIKEMLAAQAKAEAATQKLAEAAAAKAALLEKMGITEEEARLLLGGN